MKLVVPVLALLSLAAAGSALAFTNPTKAEYEEYIEAEITDDARTYLCETEEVSGLFGALDNTIGNLCDGLVNRAIANQGIQDLIGIQTDRQNRILFSTYKTETPFATYESVGVFNRFYIYSQTNTLSADQPDAETTAQ